MSVSSLGQTIFLFTFASMKKIFFLLLLETCGLFSCKNTPTQTPQVSTDSVTTKQEKPNESCYTHAVGKDTVTLHLKDSGNKVTGELVYRIYEKDMNNGVLEGMRNGDTLIAHYTFASEGTYSVREVAFLIKENKVIEGHGEMKEVNGEMTFTNRNTLTFDSTMILEKVICSY